MKLGEVGLPTFLGDLDVNFILSAVLPVWVFGAIIGLLVSFCVVHRARQALLGALAWQQPPYRATESF